jgi:molybdate transport system substrate-binding protein
MPEAARPIVVLSAGAVEYVIRQLGERVTLATGTPLDFTFRTIAGVKKLLAEGRMADIVVGTSGAIREMEEAGTLVAGTRAEIGSTETGICVQEGAPIPDISTPERLRDLLAGARSIAYSDPKVGGSSGIYLVALMDRMGVLADVQKKSVLCKNGEDIVRAVASGEAEIGSTFVSEFPLAKGVTSAGAIPLAFGNTTSYAAALLKSGSKSDAARGFLASLRSAEHRTVWSTNGFRPAA